MNFKTWARDDKSKKTDLKKNQKLSPVVRKNDTEKFCNLSSVGDERFGRILRTKGTQE